jgi:phage/plasmid primase-like uncharacterized protein
MNDLMGLAITEGIEDALTVHQATGLGAWAAGSAGYMLKLVAAVEHLAGREYDASPDCITIMADDDDDGRRHARALAAALAELSTKLVAAAAKRERQEGEGLLAGFAQDGSEPERMVRWIKPKAHFEIVLREATL